MLRTIARTIPFLLLFVTPSFAKENPAMPPAPKDVPAKVKRILGTVGEVARQGPFRPEWDSLESYEVPDWYQDAKFGIFIHWGLYSVPAYANEWYTRNMYAPQDDAHQHHVATYGETSKFGLKDFIPLFRAGKWDPAAWAKLFKRSGARYVVPVAEHHDGFQMYDSELSRWTAAKMGPKRDLLGELAEALRKEGLVFGLSTHRAEHWWFLNTGRGNGSDVEDPAFADFYGPARPEHETPTKEYLEDWQARTAELIEKYKPQVLYFDWWIEQPVFKPYLKELAAFYYNRAEQWKKGVALNYKNDAFPEGAAVLDVERGTLPRIRPLPWQTCTSVGWKSWGYLEKEDYKSPAQLIRDFVDIVSKNGVLLLNVGPRPDGTIPKEAASVLEAMGDWLAVNGEAVYGTRPWIEFGEGPNRVKDGGMFNEGKVTYAEGDVRFTRKGDSVYVISLAVPTKPLTVTLLGEKALEGVAVKSVSILGSSEKAEWNRDAKALVLAPPGKKPCDHCVVYRVVLDGSAARGDAVKVRGDELQASAILQNYGKRKVSCEAVLLADGKVVATGDLEAEGGGEDRILLSAQMPKAGLYRVELRSGRETLLEGKAALPEIPLSGEWLFAKGDDMKWKEPGFDDAGWQKVDLPEKWEVHSGYVEDNVYGWFRKTIRVPAEWKGADLVLPLGKIDDCDVAYFNGKEIGRTGVMPPKFEGAWDRTRRYPVPAKLVKFGKNNVIAVRVFDATGGGGIYGKPLGPVEVDDLK